MGHKLGFFVFLFSKESAFLLCGKSAAGIMLTLMSYSSCTTSKVHGVKNVSLCDCTTGVNSSKFYKSISLIVNYTHSTTKKPLCLQWANVSKPPLWQHLAVSQVERSIKKAGLVLCLKPLVLSWGTRRGTQALIAWLPVTFFGIRLLMLLFLSTRLFGKDCKHLCPGKYYMWSKHLEAEESVLSW